jgi:hypothetical protein
MEAMFLNAGSFNQDLSSWDESVVYNNTGWNLTALVIKLQDQHNGVVANRNMIFEEYWMYYVERTVGRTLQWGYDRRTPVPHLTPKVDEIV